MDPRNFLQVAKDLLKKDTPANCRSVFNRSYYSAYNVCVDLLKGVGIKVSESSAGHGQVNNYLGNCGIRVIEEAQSKLANLMSERIKADYKMNITTVEKNTNAQKATITAENIINTLDSYIESSGVEIFKEGVEAYIKKINSASKKIIA